MSMDQKARILEAASAAQCYVRDVVQRLTCRTATVVSLLNEMENEGLIETKTTAGPRRGRPRKLITCTMLGLEFLDAYRMAALKPLRARKKDLERAVKDAEYAERLVARGLSPFELFMELNNLARDIEVSSEATETARRA